MRIFFFFYKFNGIICPFFANNNIGGVIITFKYRHRKEIIIGVIIGIIVITLISIGTYIYLNSDEPQEETIKLEKKSTTKEEVIEEYKVDIKGEINSPGIYTLKIDSRVIDVIEKAGGLTDQADTSVINLSKKITDEMVIIIYSKTEVQNFKETKELETKVQEQCNQKDENSLENAACIDEVETTENSKVNINTATLEQLETLSGIGESKAKDIISYRETNGDFKTIEDIKNVSGIGDALFAKIKENITIE